MGRRSIATGHPRQTVVTTVNVLLEKLMCCFNILRKFKLTKNNAQSEGGHHLAPGGHA